MLSTIIKIFCSVILVIFIGCFKGADGPFSGSNNGIEDIIDNLFKEPDITPIRRILKTVMPVSYAANLTMASLEGANFPNVTVVEGGDSLLGVFLVYIEINDDFPLPAGVYADGRIIVAGLRVEYEAAIMTMIFSELNIKEGVFTVRDISTFPVVKFEEGILDSEDLLIVYGDIDINKGSDTLITVDMSGEQIEIEFNRIEDMLDFDTSLLVEEDAWIIRVNNNNTLADAMDDKYIILGGGQYAEIGNGGEEIIQIVILDLVMSPVCNKNPIAGWILHNNLGISLISGIEIGRVLFAGHPECDGKIDVIAATGVYITSWGKSIPLHLDY